MYRGVDSKHHASVTMPNLSTIKESGIRIINSNNKSRRRILSFLVSWNGGCFCCGTCSGGGGDYKARPYSYCKQNARKDTGIIGNGWYLRWMVYREPRNRLERRSDSKY